MKTPVIIRPLVTEKAMSEANKDKYSFVVTVESTKSQIKYAVKKMFNVMPVSVSTSIVKGRSHRVGLRRAEVVKPNFKKAIVTLKKGDKIAFAEIGSESKK